MIEGPDGWRLAPEGAAVHPLEKLAVIADVHLGYEWARGAGGDCLPAHSLAETLAKLASLLARATITRLVVAGDLVESPAPCRRTAARPTSPVRLARRSRGRTDPRAGQPRPARVQGPALRPSRSPAGPSPTVTGRSGPRKSISGHHHPVLRADGLTAPCFLIGPSTIVLPAFTPNAAGLPVGSSGTPDRWLVDNLRCVAGLGGELLDFGPLPDLVAMLRGSTA